MPASCAGTAWRHRRARRRAEAALGTARPGPVVVLRDEAPYAYALSGRSGRSGRVVASTGMLAALTSRERRALFAHERAHPAGRHDRLLLTVRLAAQAHPFLRPLRTAVTYTAERWADEEAAAHVGSRKAVARAIGKAALASRGTPTAAPARFAAAGPAPRRVAALLAPAPTGRAWPPASTAVGLAVWTAAGGATVSALSSANPAVTLCLVLHAATFSA